MTSGTGGATSRSLGVRMVVVLVLTGIGAGLAGMLLTLLLHLTQHLAYGYDEGTFLPGVERAAPSRRVEVLAIGGLVVGLGWWAQRRWWPVATVAQALAVSDAQAESAAPAELAAPAESDAQSAAQPGNNPQLPLHAATADCTLQIVAVGCGASLGREGAPRELGAAAGTWLAQRAGLGRAQQRIVVACGAGAGLAAVYNVPFGGAAFTLEILLASTVPADFAAAALTCAIAAAVAWPVITTRSTYDVPAVGLSASMLAFAPLLGVLAGLVATAFNRLTDVAQRRRTATGWRLPVSISVVFAALGTLAMAYPQVLGNGKGPAQLAFTSGLSLPLLATLVVLKPLATAACLRSGAIGGLLTPALSIGAMLGALSGGLWCQLWAGSPPGGYALLGAAAVLAVTQRAPITAVVLVLDFTHAGQPLLVPMLIAVAVALGTGNAFGDRTAARPRH